MKHIKHTAASFIALTLSLAASVNANADTQAEAVKAIEIPLKGGLYMRETADGTPILVSGDGRFVMPGRVVDRDNDMRMIASLSDAQDAFGNEEDSQRARDGLNPGQKMLRDVNPDEMLSFTVGDQDGTKDEVVVWVDPFCPYCHRVLEMQEEFADDYVFHNIVIPLLGQNSERFVNVLACAEPSEMGQAILDRNTSVPTTSSCRTDEQIKAQRYATSAGIQSVPLTISAAGRVQTGAFRSLQQFQAFLEDK